MAVIKIAYLGLPQDGAPAGFAAWNGHLCEMARGVVAASHGLCEIQVLLCGESPRQTAVYPGVSLHVLPTAGQSAAPQHAVSWELPDALADAQLVHLHETFSRWSELGLLIAKHQRKPVCLTQYGVVANSLIAQISLLDLADVVVCHSQAVAAGLRATVPIEIVPRAVDPACFGLIPGQPSVDRDPPADAIDYAMAGAGLLAVYRRLLAVRREAAA